MGPTGTVTDDCCAPWSAVYRPRGMNVFGNYNTDAASSPSMQLQTKERT